MKTIIKGKKVQVNYELGQKSNGEPVVNESLKVLEETEVKVIENDVVFNKGEEIYFDETTSAKVLNIKKTLDGITYVYTDYQVREENQEEKELIQKMYDRAYEKYADNLLIKYPNIRNLLKIMGKEHLSSEEIVEAVKSFNGIQNDFFTK